MTHYIGTIYFLGKYRPLSVEGESLEEVMVELTYRPQEAPQEVRERVKELWLGSDPRYTRQSVEEGWYGASWIETDRHPLDSELWERVWQSMPPCPNLIYN
jgi:hypothetical protein